MIPVDSNYQQLKGPVSLDVVIERVQPVGLHGFFFHYQLWTINEGSNQRDKPHTFLYSPTDMNLYPGQRALVTGDQIWKPNAQDNINSLVLQYVEFQNLELHPDQYINLKRPKKSDDGTATYAGSLSAVVNGRYVPFNITVIMRGAIIEDLNAEPLAEIHNIIKPNKRINRNTYIIIANFVDLDQG